MYIDKVDFLPPGIRTQTTGSLKILRVKLTSLSSSIRLKLFSAFLSVLSVACGLRKGWGDDWGRDESSNFAERFELRVADKKVFTSHFTLRASDFFLSPMPTLPFPPTPFKLLSRGPDLMSRLYSKCQSFPRGGRRLHTTLAARCTAWMGYSILLASKLPAPKQRCPMSQEQKKRAEWKGLLRFLPSSHLPFRGCERACRASCALLPLSAASATSQRDSAASNAVHRLTKASCRWLRESPISRRRRWQTQITDRGEGFYIEVVWCRWRRIRGEFWVVYGFGMPRIHSS